MHGWGVGGSVLIASTPFRVAIVPARSGRTQTSGGGWGGTKEALGAAEFVSSKGPFCLRRARRTVAASTCDGRRAKPQPGDVLTIHCHVYNGASPGFSVMTKGGSPTLFERRNLSAIDNGCARVSARAREASLPRYFKRAPKCRGTKPPPHPHLLLFFFQVTILLFLHK